MTVAKAKALTVDGFVVVVLFLATSAFSTNFVGQLSLENINQGSPTLQAIWFSMYLVTFLLAMNQLAGMRRLFAANHLLIAFLGILLFSSFWSENIPLSLRKSVGVVFSALFAMYMSARYSVSKQASLFGWAVMLAIVMSLIAQLCFPGAVPKAEFGNVIVDEHWNGLFSNKNGFGHMLALGVLCTLAFPARGNLNYLVKPLVWGGLISVIVISDSQTALSVSFIITMLWPLFAILRWQARSLSTLGVATVLAATAGGLGCIAASAKLASLVGRDSSMTGRTEIWSLALNSALSRPLLGYGFNGFWNVSVDSLRVRSLLGWDAPYAHNAYVDITLQLGFVGIVTFVLILSTSTRRAIGYVRRHTAEGSRWPLACIVFTVIYGITESDLIEPNWICWMLFVTAVSSVNLRSSIASQLDVVEAHPELPSYLQGVL